MYVKLFLKKIQLNSICVVIYLITPVLMKIRDVFNLVFLSIVNIIAISTVRQASLNTFFKLCLQNILRSGILKLKYAI